MLIYYNSLPACATCEPSLRKADCSTGLERSASLLRWRSGRSGCRVLVAMCRTFGTLPSAASESCLRRALSPWFSIFGQLQDRGLCISIHLEAARTIEKLDDVADRSLARLGEVRLQPLDHEHHQHLAKQNLTKSDSDVILSTAVTFLERAEPSSSARRTSLRTSSCMAGPRN